VTISLPLASAVAFSSTRFLPGVAPGMPRRVTSE
jgi:hypothetical protein